MDQLSMANGVEARVPFVSVELYEFVSTLPARMLLSRKGNKRVLREALKTWGFSHPERPKRAFFTPLTSRHQRELEALAREWLSTSMIRKHGVVSDVLVRDTIEKLRAGDFLASKRIVTLATLHIWLEQDFTR
jgi:asparagine synthase (glutamine-hydrolysing)